MKNKKRNPEAQAEQLIALTESAKNMNINAFDNIPPGVLGMLPKFPVSDSFEEHKKRVEELYK